MQLGIEISINLPGIRVKADLNEARMGKGKVEKKQQTTFSEELMSA